ncbi:hypothetical protein [Streptomyces sp. NPDC005141]
MPPAGEAERAPSTPAATSGPTAGTTPTGSSPSPRADPSVYALRLADAGVLAAFPSAHTLETLLRPQYRSSFKLNPNEEESICNPEKRVAITDVFQGQALAVLSPSGKARVVAREYRMVDCG